MNKKKTMIIAVVASATLLATSVAVFADQTKAGSQNTFGKFFGRGMGQMDPAQRLEREKAAVQQRVKDGKMTQEQADKLIAQMDQRTKEMQEFSSMTVDQKKKKLLDDFTASTGTRVKDGKLTQEKADQMLADFKAKLDQWDGSGNPPFMGRDFMGMERPAMKGEARPGMKGEARPGPGAGFKGGRESQKGFGAKVDPAQMLEKQKENLQQRVKDGKLTQAEADKMIAQMEQKIKEMKEFESMTLEQKKEKLQKDFSQSLSGRVKEGKLTQENADKMIADFKARLSQWDGSGRMPFPGMGPRDGKGFEGRPHKGMDGKASKQQYGSAQVPDVE